MKKLRMAQMQACLMMGIIVFCCINCSAQMKLWNNLSKGNSAGDLKSFSLLEQEVKECSTKYKEFKSLVSKLIIANPQLSLVDYNKSSHSYFIATHKGQFKDVSIDMKQILAFPKMTINASGNRIYPKGVPPWATTSCMVLAHELSERLYMVRDKDSYDKAHRKGIAFENRMRKENGSNQCRSTVNYRNDFKDNVPHSNHKDLVKRIGFHNEYIHLLQYGGDSYLSISYEIGYDRPCTKDDYNSN